jgi:hypothetical protein
MVKIPTALGDVSKHVEQGAPYDSALNANERRRTKNANGRHEAPQPLCFTWMRGEAQN